MLARFALLFVMAASAAAKPGDHTGTVTLLQGFSAVHTVEAKSEKLVSDNQSYAFGEKGEQSSAPLKLSAVFAEYVAMALFVVIGCGSAMAVAKESGWVLQVALSFGFAISSLAYAIGHYSGGQMNCAVTLGLVLTGQCAIVQGILNFIAQILGSITGALILRGMFPEAMDKTGGLGSNGVSEGWSQLHAFVGEMVMTFLLMFVVLETATNPAAKANSALAPLAIGFAVFLAHSVLIPIDGCSINPTRSFGPALVAKLSYKEASTFGDMWVFWAGPIAGSVGAAIVSTLLMG